MSRKSDHLQAPVRSAQGEIGKKEFQLCNLRRITSAREPLAVEQEQRKISPVRRKLRKPCHSQQVNRLLTNVYPNHLMRDYASIEEKPPCPHHPHNENALQISKATSSVCDGKLDLGPTELIYSSPCDIPSSVFSSLSSVAPSCSSMPASSVSTTSISSENTLKILEVPEEKEENPKNSLEPEVTSLPDVKPSSAFQKCCKNGFQNVEDIIKLSPRELTLLPRSLYLAAQLASTPNVNYSEKYGFRAFCDSKWASPRTIAFKLRAKSAAKNSIAIPDYFKEASHPLSDLRLIAKPWWLPIYKKKENTRETFKETKPELFDNDNRGLFDCFSGTNITNSTMHENSEYEKLVDNSEHDKLLDNYGENNIQRTLFQELKSDSKGTVEIVDQIAERSRSYFHVKSRGVQTYITFPYYTESRVEFWNDCTESSVNESVSPLKEHRRGAEYHVETITCGINTHQSDYQQETNSNVVFEQMNNVPTNNQSLPQFSNSLVYRYFNGRVLGNMNHQYKFVPALRYIQNSMELKNYQNEKFMTPGSLRNGTGDTGEKVTTQSYLLPVTEALYSGRPISKIIRDIGLRSISSLNTNMWNTNPMS